VIHAILLAAGQSRRMGAQKLLLPFAGGTVIGHIAAQIAAGGVDGIVAVVRPGAADVAEALAGQAVRMVTNPDADGDMLSSVRCGLRALPAECDAVLVALGDQPAVTAELIRRMIAAFHAAAPAPAPAASATGRIVVPAYEGRRGHPMLFSACYRREILADFDGAGLRGLLAAHPAEVIDLPAAGPAVLSDMDGPEDYRRELARLEAGGHGRSSEER
jgi:molybdenum cofactor cytidylyltransferase